MFVILITINKIWLQTHGLVLIVIRVLVFRKIQVPLGLFPVTYNRYHRRWNSVDGMRAALYAKPRPGKEASITLSMETKVRRYAQLDNHQSYNAIEVTSRYTDTTMIRLRGQRDGE